MHTWVICRRSNGGEWCCGFYVEHSCQKMRGFMRSSAICKIRFVAEMLCQSTDFGLILTRRYLVADQHGHSFCLATRSYQDLHSHSESGHRWWAVFFVSLTQKTFCSDKIWTEKAKVVHLRHNHMWPTNGAENITTCASRESKSLIVFTTKESKKRAQLSKQVEHWSVYLLYFIHFCRKLFQPFFFLCLFIYTLKLKNTWKMREEQRENVGIKHLKFDWICNVWCIVGV